MVRRLAASLLTFSTVMSIRRALICLPAFAASGLLSTAAQAQIDVLTNRYDGARTGANLAERTLTPANVNVAQFGKLYSYPVDGAVYAQPLYVSGLAINGAVRNVLYIATMNDKVYAFDADSASPTPLWTIDYTSPANNITAVPMLDIVNPTYNIRGNVGIESTPVIDRFSGTMYLVVRTKENGTYFQRLHAVDITTGKECAGSPVTITAKVPGSGPDAVLDGAAMVINFNPRMQQQRAGLALTNGVVLISWGGHEDKPPYHGWIMGFDAKTLARVSAFAVCADGYSGGIWQGGRAPTIDGAGNAYFATGNGRFDGNRNWGDSLLKFGVSPAGLSRDDYFPPGNEATLNLNDDDLSGSGFTLLPGTGTMPNLLLGGGKEGVLYLLNADDLGHKVTGDTQIPQKIAVNGGHVMGGPVYWNSQSAGLLVYNWAEDDVLLSYGLVNGRLAGPYAQGAVRSPGHPGGSLTVSANGSTPNTGIVWASIPTSQNAKLMLVAGILRAFDAETLQQLWTSEDNAARDRVGTLIKFVPPVVANGKVFMPTHDNAVAVYGRLPPAAEIVLYAKNAQPIAGAWSLVADSSAAGGARIENPNAGAAKIATPAASPAKYFELTFTAQAKVPYHLWIRGRAQNNSYSNDSVYVQFSGSVTDANAPTNRIGTVEAAPVVLEDCSGCGVAGWGWQDNAYGVNALGPNMYFTAGTQTIRIQQREDGISIDQIVLSPALYLSKSPGVTKNDATILLESDGGLPPAPTTGTVVKYAGEAAVLRGNWRIVADATAAGGARIEQPDAGVPKITTAAVNPQNYFELTFSALPNTPYRIWLRGRAQNDSYSNDSVYVQFSGSVNSSGAPINRIGTTEAVAVVLENCSGCGLAAWGWQDNGYGTGVLGQLLYFSEGTQTIRMQGREDGISIYQIVLSPDTYLTSSPGATKNDTTILPKTR